MAPNFLVIALSALIPLVVGFIWYNEKVMGTVWMHEAGLSKENGQNLNMTRILIANLVMGILLAMGLSFVVIHQAAIYSIFANDPSLNEAGSPLNTYVADFMAKYGNNFRTFKHGAFHGFGAALSFVLPIVSVSALWEGRSWKYIGVTVGYWTITMMLMGGIICAFA